MSWAVKHPLTTLETLAWLKWKQHWPYQELLVPGWGEGWEWGYSFILDSLAAFPTSIIAWVEQNHCCWSFGNSNNYWPGLWLAWKLTHDWGKSSHNPIKSASEGGPVNSPRCQWVEPAPLRGAFLELINSHVCDSWKTVAESWGWGLCWYPQPLRLNLCLLRNSKAFDTFHWHTGGIFNKHVCTYRYVYINLCVCMPTCVNWFEHPMATIA